MTYDELKTLLNNEASLNLCTLQISRKDDHLFALRRMGREESFVLSKEKVLEFAKAGNHAAITRYVAVLAACMEDAKEIPVGTIITRKGKFYMNASAGSPTWIAMFE